uniref:Uncharacterized protein n=1 Tax=Branchiostoma floridae TaxID=7739 RepID=C3Y9N9_BRAFL|eukprot:XP_002607285.1 hypothetical protein BRAFLDRAFT_88234 [Branchiostoma floridae]
MALMTVVLVVCVAGAFAVPTAVPTPAAKGKYEVQRPTMKTPTLVLAAILAMAVEEETIDDASMTHTDEETTQSDGSPINSKETKLLDLLKKLATSKSEQKEMPEEKQPSDVEQNYDVAEIGSQDSIFEAAEEDKEAANEQQNYNVAGIGDHGSTFEGNDHDYYGLCHVVANST